MFAGAAREAVFSSDEIAQRVNKQFVPVALKAALINNPPPGIEGALYAEISRSKPAPQGICVANSAGKVLSWVLSFDNDASIGHFLDYALERYEASPDAARPVRAERFMRYPSGKLRSIEDSGRSVTHPDSHAKTDRCPALPKLQRGTLVGRIIGRPLNKDRQPLAKTLRQEDYMEARFEIPVDLQQRFATALADTPTGESFAVPSELARQLVRHAYLGQLDVNPLGGRQTGAQTEEETIAFHARRYRSDQQKQIVRVTGTSKVAGGPSRIGVRTDGRQWEHRVQLAWEGFFDVEADRITGLVFTAEGTEKLRWGNPRLHLAPEPAVAHLMAGHPIDLNCEVRYGLVAQPCAEHEVAEADDADKTSSRTPGVGGRLPMQQRLAHLREAVKHLRAAGANDLADQIAQQVRKMEQSLQRERE